MKLYVANCSRQKHHFNYKLPEKSQQFGKPIASGCQIMIEQNHDVIQHIIDQHARYGFSDIRRLDKNFSGICYSIDKEVDFAAFRKGAEQKTENLERQSMENLTAAAVALDNTIDREVMKTGEVAAPSEQGVEMEIIGEAVDKEQENAPSFNATLKVTKKK
ncbi:hypothetical protein [Citrobacter arsenatis]|uniref:hypothetical protein n=1 Tax=Citrobacter arsenatis TaxID=2546350 RepID=UPI00300DD0F2